MQQLRTKGYVWPASAFRDRQLPARGGQSGNVAQLTMSELLLALGSAINKKTKDPIAMPSLRSHLLVALLRVTRRKRIYSSIDAMVDGIKKVRQQGPARPTPGMMGDVVVEREVVNNIEVYRLSPSVTPALAMPVLYLHGGAYIRPITSFHWRFLRSIVEQTGCTFIVPLYPLAPEANCAQAVAAVTNVYIRECTRAGVESVAVMGDSAGGGLALALCYALRQKATPLPRSLVLICPWLDVTMTNPLIGVTEKNDPMLATIGTREAGRLYAGDLGLQHCYVSPLYGDPSGLPPILLFAGTNDIVHYDGLLFAEKARAAGSPVDLQIGQEMIHVWPILPIPEGKEAREKVAQHLLSCF